MATRKKRTKKRSSGSAGDSGVAERDASGRFLPGNTTGRRGGNPHFARLAEYRQTLNATLTPDKIEGVVNRLVKLANAGDVQAAKVLLDRALGKVKPAPDNTEPIALGIDSLTTVEDVKRASQAILVAIVEGRVSPDDGSKLAAIVDLVRRSIETQELEARIRVLEEHGEDDE